MASVGCRRLGTILLWNAWNAAGGRPEGPVARKLGAHAGPYMKPASPWPVAAGVAID